MKDELTAAYDRCKDVTKREARNFYYGFMLLPAQRRRAIYAAYAFARECDDIVDAHLPAEEASVRLVAYRKSLDRCLEGRPQGPVFLALGDAIDRYEIPHDYFYR
ncbi:MAG: squalene/phytoene synthase family protein, partial [Dehalococcoidia bacterium]